MVPVNQAAVSLFGASLGPPTALTEAPSSGSLASVEPMSAAPGTAAEPAPFADLLTDAVGEVQHLEVQAKSAIEGLISGRGVDVHEAMIAAQKAGMGFELMLAVRNKALAAYQQVLGMQF